ncbi:hypothetical protein PVK06_042393 [Gossypium arboreum]|uniref:Uncharacterized protein n=1 Tax=Gossypium arboreum TaxID=29729 RepID=A0ABR0MKN2_GOSAR|nr:hypothetical protein PVK06_042393 [Gossypium arboreum]
MKVVEAAESDLGQIVFNEIMKNAKKFEGKHIVNDLAKEPYYSKSDNTGKEEDTQSKDVPITTGTKFIPLNIKQRIIDEFNSNIKFNQRHVDRMQVEANVVKKVVTPLTWSAPELQNTTITTGIYTNTYTIINKRNDYHIQPLKMKT